MDFDTILPDIGDFGTYQRLILYFVLLPGVLPCGFHAYNQIFMAASPNHWCRVPQLDQANVSREFAQNVSIPMEPGPVLGEIVPSQCRMYALNYTALLLSGQSEVVEEIVPCQNGWTYEHAEYIATVVTDWDLVCDKDYYTTIAYVLFAVGGLIGSCIFGYLQDSLGRRPSFFIYLFINCAFGIATAFAQDYLTWTLLRIGVGFTIPAILGTPYVLSIELVGPEKRTLCTVLSNIAYSLGLVLLAGVVYLIREWRQLALATSVPFLAFFLYWWVLPESPRWLLARGRFHEAEVIIKKIARVNGRTLPPNYMVHLKRKFQVEKHIQEQERNFSKNYGIMDLLRTPNLRRKTLIITFIWFTNTSVYVGLSYYAPALGGDEFLNFFLAGVVELPTYLVLWPAMEYYGRRWILCISMVIGGTACLATFLVQNNETVTLVLYCVGKMGISSSYVVLPLMASELYPTVVRGLGMSASTVVGMLGPTFIPIVNYMGADMLVLPLMIMGGLLVLGGIFSLFLPETLHQRLPQTLEDGENFGREWGGCKDFFSCRAKDPPPNRQPDKKGVESPIRSLMECQAALTNEQKEISGLTKDTFVSPSNSPPAIRITVV